MSDFYDNLVSGKYNTYEKVASAEDETVRETLSELTQGQIEALSDALGGITKRASELSLEDTLSYEFEEAIERTASEEDPKEETKEESKTEDKKEESKKEDIKEKEADEEEEIEQNASEEELSELEKEMEVEASEGDDDSKEEKKEEAKEDKEEKKDGDNDDDDDSQQSVPTDKAQAKEKCAEEEEVSFEKLSAEEQFEITKQACEEVENTLAEAGYTVADYVYSLTGLEKHANEIAEQAEKLAKVHEIPVIMATNHILSAMNEILDAE